jgi:hypothetical protein
VAQLCLWFSLLGQGNALKEHIVVFTPVLVMSKWIKEQSFLEEGYCIFRPIWKNPVHAFSVKPSLVNPILGYVL